jgi:hypothetical protein
MFSAGSGRDPALWERESSSRIVGGAGSVLWRFRLRRGETRNGEGYRGTWRLAGSRAFSEVLFLIEAEVAAPIDRQFMDEGRQEVDVDASKLSSGVCFCHTIVRTSSDPETDTQGTTCQRIRKMMLMK